MLRLRITRAMTTVVAVGTLAVAAAASPAMAAPIDFVQFDTPTVDFGNAWAGGSPTTPGELDWDTGNGATCLSGNLYMKNADGVSARVELEMYTDNSAAAHTAGPIGTTRSKIKTAVGNGLNIIPLTVPCIVSPGTHVHLRLLDDRTNIGGPLTLDTWTFADE